MRYKVLEKFEDGYQEMMMTEINVAKGIIRSLKRVRKFGIMEWTVTRRIEDPEHSAEIFGGCDVIQFYWFDAKAWLWLDPEDCADWTSPLWMRAYYRLYIKIKTGYFTDLLESVEYEPIE